ncbi:LPXTG cell wall anchor domain-containing protein [Listeria booriae]|uniref:LPXTG cell wall anchor domain-containing protein n=1 Tax=Listeria booriae TaxID=1552123 RepID=UPI0016241E0F|nr:LPXTG cell wall anchor domain-containing protein [Listeria booriae]MBC1920463.1 LPXTG cell wall anchor domain-containing protein [Listeria booriae]
MKKLFKILLALTVIFNLVPSALFATKASAATTTFTIKANGTDYSYYKGDGASHVEGRDRVDYMIDTQGNPVFCLEFNLLSANSSIPYTKGGDLNYQVNYIVDAFHGNGTGAQFMKGDTFKKYFIAQNAIRILLGQNTARVLADNESFAMGHGGDVSVITNINALANAAKNAPKPAVPTLTSALSFSNTNLTFTKGSDGNYYTQTTRAVSTTNGKQSSGAITGTLPTGFSYVNTSHGHLNSVATNQDFQIKALPAVIEGKNVTLNLSATANYELGYPVAIKYVTTNPAYQTVTGYDYDYLNASKTATATAKIDDRRGSLKIIKRDDKNNVLAGVEFTVSDSNNKVLQNITVDAKGEGIVSNLLPGSYIVTEIKGKKGYVVDSKPQVVNVKIEETAELNFVNKLMTGSIKVHKVDQDGKALAGAEMTLTDETGTSVVQVTDETGYATFGMVANKTYDLKETKNPEGYHGTFEEKGITIENDGQVFEYTAENTLNKGAIEVLKVDQDGKPLAGAEMTLTDETGAEVVQVTDQDGKAKFDVVANKTYDLKETKNPKGYHGTFEEKGITIENDGQVFEYTAKNTLDKGAIKVLKVDQDGKPLAGAEMTLTDETGAKVVQVTDQDGKARFDVVANKTYDLKETKNPKGYHGIFEEKGITIEKDGQVFEYTAKNTLDKGTIEVLKVDQDGKPLAGAEMTLTDETGAKVVQVTDQDGKAKFDVVANKTYDLKETKNPKGYHGTFEEKGITIEKDGHVLSYKAKNTKDAVFISKISNNTHIQKLVKTGDSPMGIAVGLGAVLIGFASIYLLRRKKGLA